MLEPAEKAAAEIFLATASQKRLKSAEKIIDKHMQTLRNAVIRQGSEIAILRRIVESMRSQYGEGEMLKAIDELDAFDSEPTLTQTKD